MGLRFKAVRSRLDHGYSTIRLQDFLEWKERGKVLPTKSILITLDDGYQGIAQNALPLLRRYGILPKGRILQSPCRRFHLQLIEPKPGIFEVEPDEMLQRIGLGTPDVAPAHRPGPRHGR